MAEMTYRPDIDGLRGIAVLMVLIFHFDLTGSYGAGFLGVDIFFVISGFLITSIILKETELNRFDLRDFYIKRIRRLAPALAVTLLIVSGLGLLWLFPIDLLSLTKQVIAAQLYASNLYYWKTLNYFGLTARSAFLLHTWSLAVEEQFYLIYPITMLFLLKHFRSRLWQILSIAALISFILNIFFVFHKPEATFYLLPTRAWELLTGALTVCISQRKSALHGWEPLIGYVGLIAVCTSFLALDTSYRYPGFAALVPTFGAACLISSGGTSQSPASKLLTLPPLTYIGKLSYPLYLVHWPILTFAEYRFEPQPSLSLMLLLLGLSVVAAAAIFHFVENPVRHRVVLARSKSLIAAYAPFLVISIAACLFVQNADGLPGRYPKRVLALASYANDKTEEMPQCEYRPKITESPLCIIGDRNSKPTWLIYGDSHAWATYHAFDSWLKAMNKSGYFVFRHACAPIRGAHIYHDENRCFDFNEEMFSFLKRESDVKNVFLVSIWRQAIDGFSSSDDSVATAEGSKIIFRNQLRQMIRDFKSIGKLTYVWEPLPCARQNVPEAMASAELDGTDYKNIEFTRREYLSEFNFFFEALSHSGVAGTLSTSNALCASGLCSVQENGVPLYFDNNHPTKSASTFWAKVLSNMKPSSDD